MYASSLLSFSILSPCCPPQPLFNQHCCIFGFVVKFSCPTLLNGCCSTVLLLKRECFVEAAPGYSGIHSSALKPRLRGRLLCLCLVFPLPPSTVRVLFPGTAYREDAVGFALFSVAETMSAIRFTTLYSIPFCPSWISITAHPTHVRMERPASTGPPTTTALAQRTMRAKTALTSKTTVAPPRVKVRLLQAITTSLSFFCLFPERF